MIRRLLPLLPLILGLAVLALGWARGSLGKPQPSQAEILRGLHGLPEWEAVPLVVRWAEESGNVAELRYRLEKTED